MDETKDVEFLTEEIKEKENIVLKEHLLGKEGNAV